MGAAESQRLLLLRAWGRANLKAAMRDPCFASGTNSGFSSGTNQPSITYLGLLLYMGAEYLRNASSKHCCAH